jgi:hypothetical protein
MATASSVTLVAYGGTPPSKVTDTGQIADLFKCWWPVPGTLVLTWVVLAAVRASRTPKEVADKAGKQLSRHVEVKQKSIVHNMRAGEKHKLFLALQDIAFLQYYAEEVIVEVANAVARVGSYQEMAFLDDCYRCQLSRFLHMMLERNRRANEFQVINTRMLAFEELVSDCTFCSSLAPRSRWIGRFWTELWSLLPKVGEGKS